MEKSRIKGVRAKTRHYRTEIACLLLVVGALVPFVWKFWGWTVSDHLKDWSDFGTYVGFSVSLISVALVYVTYRGQKEMSYVMQFESIFFEWLKVHRDIYEKSVGHICNLESEFRTRLDNLESVDAQSVRTVAGEKGETRCILSYYRNLYHLLKYVDENRYLTRQEDTKRYFDIVQAQLSDEEIFVVLFLALQDEEEDLGELTERFNRLRFIKNVYYPCEGLRYRDFYWFLTEKFDATRFKHSPFPPGEKYWSPKFSSKEKVSCWSGWGAGFCFLNWSKDKKNKR